MMSETRQNAESDTKTTAVAETQRENTNSAAKYVNKETMPNRRNVVEREKQELKLEANLGKEDPPSFELKHDLSEDSEEETFYETEPDIEHLIKRDQSRELELENTEEDRDRAKQKKVFETKFDDLIRTNEGDTNSTINFDNVDVTNANASLETEIEFHTKELQLNETLLPEDTGKITNLENTNNTIHLIDDTNNTINHDNEDETNAYVLLETEIECHNKELQLNETLVPEDTSKITNVEDTNNIINFDNEDGTNADALFETEANLGKEDPPSFELKHDLSEDSEEETFYETEPDIEHLIKGDQRRKLELENKEEDRDRAKHNKVCETKFDDLIRTNEGDTNNTINLDNEDGTNANALIETEIEFHSKELKLKETHVPEDTSQITNVEDTNNTIKIDNEDGTNADALLETEIEFHTKELQLNETLVPEDTSKITNVEDTNNTINFDNEDGTNADALFETEIEFHTKELQLNQTLVPEDTGKITNVADTKNTINLDNIDGANADAFHETEIEFNTKELQLNETLVPEDTGKITNVEDTNNTINLDNVDGANADAFHETEIEFHTKELQLNETHVPEDTGKITEPDGKKANNETNQMASDKEAKNVLLTENLHHRETAILDLKSNIPESGEQKETHETKNNFKSEKELADLHETNVIYVPDQNGDEESEENEKVTAKQGHSPKASNGRKSTKEDTFLTTDSNGVSEMKEDATCKVHCNFHTERNHNDSPTSSNTDTKACSLCETETTDETHKFFLFNESFKATSFDLINDDKRTDFSMEELHSDHDGFTQRKSFQSEATETDIVAQYGTSDAVVSNSNESSIQGGEPELLLSCLRRRQWKDKGKTENLTLNNIDAEKHDNNECAPFVSIPMCESNSTFIPSAVYGLSEYDGHSRGKNNSMHSPDNFEDSLIFPTRDDPDVVVIDHQRRKVGQTDKDSEANIDRLAFDSVHEQDQQCSLPDDQFQTKNESLPESIASDFGQSVDDLKSNCQEKDGGLDRLRTEHQSYERMLVEQSRELTQLKAEQQTLDRTCQEKSEELDQLRNEHHSYKLMYQEQTEDLELMRTDNENLKERNAHLSAAVQELRKEIARVQAEFGSYQKHTEDYEQIKGELNDVRRSLIPGKDAESAVLTSRVQQLTAFVVQQQEKIQSLEAAVVDFQKLQELLHSHRNELTCLQTAKSAIEEQSKKLYEDYLRLNNVVVPEKNKHIDSITQANTLLQGELQSLKDEIVSLRNEKASLEEGFRILMEENGHLKETVIPEKSSFIESVTQENFRIQGELQKHAETIATLHREKSHYMQQCRAMNDQLRNLKERVIPEKDGNIISLWQQITALQKKHDDMMLSVRSLESLPASPLYNALVVVQKFYCREFGTKTSITPENVQHLHRLVEVARSELHTVSDIEGKVAEAIVTHINMIEENIRLHGLVGELVIENGQLKNQIQQLKVRVSSFERKQKRNPRTEE